MTTPLYETIRLAVARPILTGELAPGDRIPSEAELMERFGCSRMTVSKALAALAEQGLITRRRKAGSFVAEPTARHALDAIGDPRQEVAALGKRYRFDLLERKVELADAWQAEALGVRRGERVLKLTCRHFADHDPFGLEDRLISLAAVPEAEQESFLETPPGAWLLERAPWSEGEHTIRAEAAGPRTAGLLGLDEDAACLVVERRTWQAGTPVTQVRLTYPGARHAITGRFLPPGQTEPGKVGRSW